MRIALTGGIACGKSLVAKYLNEFGVETIDADDIVHELLPDSAERKRLAAKVFNDPVARRELEARLHPLVKARIDAFLGQSRESKVQSPQPSSNVESLSSSRGRTFDVRRSTLAEDSGQSTLELRMAVIPLLFETHWDAEYDIICCVKSDRSVQIERMMTTRGYAREEAEARLAAQLPVEEKAAKSHYVIENNGSAEELKSKVRKFVVEVRTLDDGR